MADNARMSYDGMILWLDATDESTIECDPKTNEIISWRSKLKYLNGIKLQSKNVNIRPIFRKPVDKIFPLGVYFDYDHTMTFNKPITDVQTIISFHSFENNQCFQ